MLRTVHFLLILSLFGLTTPASAQKGCWCIQVDGYGLVQLTYADLKEAVAGLPGATTEGVKADRIALLLQDRRVPLLVEDGGDGWFGPGDGILFFSTESRCLYTNTNIYHLAFDADQGAALAPAPPPPEDSLPKEEDPGRDICHIVFQKMKSTGTTLTLKWSRFLRKWAPLFPDGKPKIAVEVDVDHVRDLTGALEVRTPGRTRKIPLPPEGRIMVPYDQEADGVEKGQCRLTVSLSRETRIALVLKAVRPWNNGCTSFLKKKGPGLLLLHGLPRTPFLAYHVVDKRLLWTGPRQTRNGTALAIHLPDGKHRVLLATREGLLKPRRIFRVAAPVAPGPAGGTAFLALAPRHLVPTLAAHLAWRKQDLGSARAVALEDIYQTYSRGQPDPEAIRTYLQQTGKGRLRYLLLVGEARPRMVGYGGSPYATPARRFDTLATLPPLRYHPRGEEDRQPYAVDAPYGDLDGDGQPEIAVGRIPCRTPAQLQAVLVKIREYEQHRSPGPLARRVFIQAGLGRFGSRGGNKMLGALLERMLENIARKLVDRCVPPFYDLEAIYSSPSSQYFHAPSGFRRQVAAGLEKGFFAAFYIGHGNIRSYDTFTWRKRSYDTFLAEDAAALNIRSLRGVYFALTCLSGTIPLERGKLCMAGELCLNPRGPVGVVASSGPVSEQMNLLVTVATLQAFFTDRIPRLGDLLQTVKKDLATRLHSKDLAMLLGMLNGVNKRKRTEAEMLRLGRSQYTLFGDPALKIRYPGTGITLEPVGELEPGAAVQVKGKVESLAEGTAWISLELPRHKPGEKLQKVSPDQKDSDAEAALARNNALMNHRTLAAIKVPVVQGRFVATLHLPDPTPGNRVMIKVYAAGKDGDGTGCLECKVKKKK